MLAQALTFTIEGAAARPLYTEVNTRTGLPSTTFVGFSDLQSRETRESVRSALLNSGFDYPEKRVTVHLAPASLRGNVSAGRFAAALALLACGGQLNPVALQQVAVYGHLSPSGQIASLPGSLAAARACAAQGTRRLLVAAADSIAAMTCEDAGVEVAPVADLDDAVRVLRGGTPAAVKPPPVPQSAGLAAPEVADLDVPAELTGTLALAAAGGHHLLFEGALGSGHTMLARRLPSVMARLSAVEMRQVAELHGIVGLPQTLDPQPPFRAPHHTVSPAGLVGGGSPPRPGEATLAHLGVLYLQELDAFARCTLEALRTPVQERRVVLLRGDRAIELPASFILVASFAMPDNQTDAERVQRRVGSLIPYFDLRISTSRRRRLSGRPPVPTATIRRRVLEAHVRQRARGQAIPNADLPFTDIAERLTPRAAAVLHDRYRSGALSRRGRAQLARVAQTVADVYHESDDGRVDEHAVEAALSQTGLVRRV